jgi:hypothetical protein
VFCAGPISGDSRRSSPTHQNTMHVTLSFATNKKILCIYMQLHIFSSRTVLVLFAQQGYTQCLLQYCAGILKQSMGAGNREGIGLLYRPAWLHWLAESIPWNRFLGSLRAKKIPSLRLDMDQFNFNNSDESRPLIIFILEVTSREGILQSTD